MSKTEVYNDRSILGLLGVTFVVLKLLHVIEWSWWWVLAPFWIPLALVTIFLIIIEIILVATCVKNIKQGDPIKTRRSTFIKMMELAHDKNITDYKKRQFS